MTGRAAYIDGLRQLADVLEEHPDVPLPYHGSEVPATIMLLTRDAAARRAALAAVSAAIPCAWREETDDKYFDLLGEVAGFKLRLSTYREDILTPAAGTP